MVTFDDVKTNEEILKLIDNSCKVLRAMDYTEHGLRHANYVSKTAYNIMTNLNFPPRLCDLTRIAGFVHDVGNCINRYNHGITSATIMYPILVKMGMEIDEACMIVAAIGNHEEEIGHIVNEVSAALVIADKSDAHKTRVRPDGYDKNDIHDRVNYSIKRNTVEADVLNHEINSRIYMDETSSVMEYFQIYLSRIQMSERAAEYLGCTFKLYVNDNLINSPKPLTKSMLS